MPVHKSLSRPRSWHMLQSLLAPSHFDVQVTQQSHRLFTSSTIHRVKHRPKPRYSQPRQPIQSEKKALDQSNLTPPPPNSPAAPGATATPITTSRMIVGAIVGLCTLSYSVHTISEYYAAQGSTTAKKYLLFARKHMVLSERNIHEGRHYTMLTSMFTHDGLGHLAMNMLGLWTLGGVVASVYGARQFFSVYVTSGIVGAFAQAYAWAGTRRKEVNREAVGASGGVMGVFAALACTIPRGTMSLLIIPMPLWIGAAGTAVFSAAAMQQGWLPGLGHADHLGGMAWGVFWFAVSLRRGLAGKRIVTF